MPHGEPEYRRRLREKAEKDKGSAYSERDKAAENTRIEKIVLSIERIVQQIDRYTDEKAPENKRKRRWEKAEVLGLWAAAFIGATAIWVGSSESSGQRAMMQGQLNEMKFQRRPWVLANVTISDSLTYRGTEVSMGLLFKLRNTGTTPAYQAHVHISIFPDMPNFRTDPGTRCHNPPSDYPLGITVFPGETPTYDESFSTDIGDRIVISPYIVVCTFYRFPGETDWHRTPIAYALRIKRSVLRPGRGCCGLIVSDGPVPADSMELESVADERDTPN